VLRLVLALLHLCMISVAVYLRPANNLNAYTRPADAVCNTFLLSYCVILSLLTSFFLYEQLISKFVLLGFEFDTHQRLILFP